MEHHSWSAATSGRVRWGGSCSAASEGHATPADSQVERFDSLEVAVDEWLVDCESATPDTLIGAEK
jgi:hypothetical protein